MPGLPKSIIKKYGISKKAWDVFRGRKHGSVKTTTKKKSYKHRYGKKYHHKKDRRVPLIATAGAIGSLFVPRDSGHMSVGAWLLNTFQGKSPNLTEPTNITNSLDDLLAQYIGYDPRDGSWGIPMATATVIATSFASKLMNHFAKGTISKIPYVGKYLRW